MCKSCYKKESNKTPTLPSSNGSDAPRASPRASTPRIIRHVSNVLEYAAKKDVTSMTANEVDAAATYRRESDTSFNGSDLSDSFKASKVKPSIICRGASPLS